MTRFKIRVSMISMYETVYHSYASVLCLYMVFKKCIQNVKDYNYPGQVH